MSGTDSAPEPASGHFSSWRRLKNIKRQIQKMAMKPNIPPITLAIQTKLIGLMIMDESDSVHKE